MGSTAKKKLAQLELRKYMQEHKSKSKLSQTPKEIDSPLAKYNELGQLTCILCKTVVRSGAVWNVHINAKLHKQNVELAKKLKERTNNFTTPLKRPLTPPIEIPTKKPKSILKNSTKIEAVTDVQQVNKEASKSELPSDFFDGSIKKKLPPVSMISEKNKEIEPMDTDSSIRESNEILPEGFFDDPKLDAKARNQEYKDPIQEEWEKFQKEIRDAEGQSAAIIAEDQEEATTERQMEEIDEQMKNLSKVLDLEKKKEEVIAVISDGKNLENNEDDGGEDQDFNEFLDWRSKNSSFL